MLYVLDSVHNILSMLEQGLPGRKSAPDARSGAGAPFWGLHIAAHGLVHVL